MRNYVAPGKSIDLNPFVAVTAGKPLIVGSLFGIPANSAPVSMDAVVTLHLTGIYELSGAGSVGAAAYWSVADQTIGTEAAAGTYKVGVIVGPGSAEGTVQVRLNGTDVSAVAA